MAFSFRAQLDSCGNHVSQSLGLNVVVWLNQVKESLRNADRLAVLCPHTGHHSGHCDPDQCVGGEGDSRESRTHCRKRTEVVKVRNCSSCRKRGMSTKGGYRTVTGRWLQSPEGARERPLLPRFRGPHSVRSRSL